MPKKTTAEPKVTIEAIYEATVELIDSDGLKNFTMRALADRLGVYPTALYWHIGSKSQLLTSAAGFTLRSAPLEPKDDNWRSWIEAGARRRRKALHDHPELAQIITGHLSTDITSAFPWVDSDLAALESVGFTGEGLLHAYNSISAGVVRWVAVELVREPEDTGAEWRQGMRDQVDAISARRLPTLSRNVDTFANRAISVRWESGTTNPLNDSFEFFLSALLDGLEARVRTTAVAQ